MNPGEMNFPIWTTPLAFKVFHCGRTPFEVTLANSGKCIHIDADLLILIISRWHGPVCDRPVIYIKKISDILFVRLFSIVHFSLCLNYHCSPSAQSFAVRFFSWLLLYCLFYCVLDHSCCAGNLFSVFQLKPCMFGTMMCTFYLNVNKCTFQHLLCFKCNRFASVQICLICLTLRKILDCVDQKQGKMLFFATCWQLNHMF